MTDEDLARDIAELLEHAPVTTGRRMAVHISTAKKLEKGLKAKGWQFTKRPPSKLHSAG